MPLLVMQLVFSRTTQAPVPLFVRPIAKMIAQKVDRSYIGPTLQSYMEYMEAELGQSSWFAGDTLTFADIQMSYVVEAFRMRGKTEKYPKISAFLQAVRERPAYQRALEKGGPLIPSI